jgi:hypothetical protein
MKRIVLIIAFLGCVFLADAQIKYGFNNALAYDNWNNNDVTAGVELVVWTPNNDTLEITVGSDVNAIDGSARNGFEYNFTGVKCLFLPGTNIFDLSNQKKYLYNFTPNTTFFGERDFYIKLSNVQGITTDDFYNNRDLMRVIIDYDGTNVGVKKLSIHSYRLYPVPTTGSLFVEGANPTEYKVYDLSGRLAAEGSVLQSRIDVSEIANGLYVLYAQTDKGLIVQKFLKN